jgi:hypothetical protein
MVSRIFLTGLFCTMSLMGGEPKLKLNVGTVLYFRGASIGKWRIAELPDYRSDSVSSSDYRVTIVGKDENGGYRAEAKVVRIRFSGTAKDIVLKYDSKTDAKPPSHIALAAYTIGKPIGFTIAPDGSLRDVKTPNDFVKHAESLIDNVTEVPENQKFDRYLSKRQLCELSDEGILNTYQSSFFEWPDDQKKAWTKKQQKKYGQWGESRSICEQTGTVDGTITVLTQVDYQTLKGNPGVSFSAGDWGKMTSTNIGSIRILGKTEINSKTNLLRRIVSRQYGSMIERVTVENPPWDRSVTWRFTRDDVIICAETEEGLAKHTPEAMLKSIPTSLREPSLEKKVKGFVEEAMKAEGFKQRRAARKKLAALGIRAWPALDNFRDHDDPEIRHMIDRLTTVEIPSELKDEVN